MRLSPHEIQSTLFSLESSIRAPALIGGGGIRFEEDRPINAGFGAANGAWAWPEPNLLTADVFRRDLTVDRSRPLAA